MQFGSWDDFDQIAEFTLICSATGASQVNLIPIFHLGKNRIKRLVLLHGQAGKEASELQKMQGEKR